MIPWTALSDVHLSGLSEVDRQGRMSLDFLRVVALNLLHHAQRVYLGLRLRARKNAWGLAIDVQSYTITWGGESATPSGLLSPSSREYDIYHRTLESRTCKHGAYWLSHS